MRVPVLTAITVLCIATPALAQTSPQPTSPNSGAGVAGQPGSKNGPDAKSGITGQGNAVQDTSKIPGKAGSKSGPAVNPPAKQ
jgi:hypothetical protein